VCVWCVCVCGGVCVVCVWVCVCVCVYVCVCVCVCVVCVWCVCVCDVVCVCGVCVCVCVCVCVSLILISEKIARFLGPQIWLSLRFSQRNFSKKQEILFQICFEIIKEIVYRLNIVCKSKMLF